MELKIRKAYINKTVTCPKTKKQLILKELDEKTFEYYYDNGLDYIFIKVSSLIEHEVSVVNFKGDKKHKKMNKINDTYKQGRD